MKCVKRRRPQFEKKDRSSRHIFYKVNDLGEDQWRPSLNDADWEVQICGGWPRDRQEGGCPTESLSDLHWRRKRGTECQQRRIEGTMDQPGFHVAAQ